MAMGFWHGQEGRDTFCSFDFTPKSIVIFKKKFGIVKNKALFALMCFERGLRF